MTLKSIEKLREIAADINASEIVDHMELYPSCVFDGAWLDAWHNEFYRVIDMLEAEIAERFMELPEGWTGEQAADVLAYWPTWDDGSPCMFGDEFTCYPKYDYKKDYKPLDRLVIFGPNHVWNRGCDDEGPHDGGYYEWNFMRPGGDDCEEYRPTKRKPRTLEDVLCDMIHEYACTDMTTEQVAAKYADELRELLGGDMR